MSDPVKNLIIKDMATSAATGHQNAIALTVGVDRLPWKDVGSPRARVGVTLKALAPAVDDWLYLSYSFMPLRTLLAAALTLMLAAPAVSANSRSDAKAQVEFGIEVAQRGLWREALYRWNRATELDPSYAAAWNNLGIAYEHEGEFDKAREAYEKALALEPGNVMIQQNYDLFREINDRANR